VRPHREIAFRSLSPSSVVCCLFFVLCCSLFVVRCSLFIVHCSLFVIRYSLFVVHCSLSIVHCSLFVIHCSLFFVHCRMDHLHHQPTWVENVADGLHIEACLFPVFPARFGRSLALDGAHPSSGGRRFDCVVRFLPRCHLPRQIHVGQRCVVVYIVCGKPSPVVLGNTWFLFVLLFVLRTILLVNGDSW
jgi:hypothetical protein